MMIKKKDKDNIIEGYDTAEALMAFPDALMTCFENLTEESGS